MFDINVHENLIERIQDRIAYHADEKRYRYEIGKGVMRNLATDLIADFKAFNGYILPFELGGTAYIIRRKRVKEVTVVFIGIGKYKGDTAYTIHTLYNNSETLAFFEHDIGKRIFATREQAEQALNAQRAVSMVDGHIEE